MERTTTPTDPLASWTQAQQAFWDRWRTALAVDVEHLPIEFWKVAIFAGLDIQLAAAEAWRAWGCGSDAANPELAFGTCQALHSVEEWTRAQMQLWEGWFAALERLTPGAAQRPARATSETTKPRAHAHARRHEPPAPPHSHNGAPA